MQTPTVSTEEAVAKLIESFAFVPDEPVPVPVLRSRQALAAEVLRRAEHGRQKYGMSVDENLLPIESWIQHAIEEGLDLLVYLERLSHESDEAFSPFQKSLMAHILRRRESLLAQLINLKLLKRSLA